eukprot:CAMPEP_0170454866 /NCGR_PEP_ID=MMETSP0123-20130129/2977_1 /TAXON_ID=182087 /ORGANISM="Favella ehrenbergii, Strain Fehren 1" /LENGTH=178 /DNA_ID=CAMNT_0010717725 /DNA_START=232 /DNA_END=768 /DNA_ORIENTATION=-
MINQLTNRLNESTIFKIKKAFPNLHLELTNISLEAKKKAINLTLEKYRLKHTVQIIRYLNLNRGFFGKDSYITISGALARYIIRENKVVNGMKPIESLSGFVKELLNAKRTRRQVQVFDSQQNELKNNSQSGDLRLIDKNSQQFKNFFKLVADAKKQHSLEHAEFASLNRSDSAMEEE